MAALGDVTLSIAQVPESSDFMVEVHYPIFMDQCDLALGMAYLEVCELMGVDAFPEDGKDDVLLTLRKQLVFFPADGGPIQRVIQQVVPASVLDEDSGPFLPLPDEIAARVTLVPVPTLGPPRRTSNVVVLGGPVVDPV
jgi:hypothetical protein